jgi:peroxiredoxin
MPTLRRILLRTGGPFVDSVKFAMRGFTARGVPVAVACFAEGYFLSLQRPEGAMQRHLRRRYTPARLSLGLRLSLAAITFCAPALADTSYALVAHEAPDFALHAIAGGNVRLSEHRGDVVILSFWGSRCTPCREQLAALNRTLATYRSAGLQVYGINVDDDQTRALAYAHGESVTFPLLLDPEKAVSRSYLVDNLPMTLLIDRNGVVRNAFRDYNAKSEELFLQQLRALLNE